MVEVGGGSAPRTSAITPYPERREQKRSRSRKIKAHWRISGRFGLAPSCPEGLLLRTVYRDEKRKRAIAGQSKRILDSGGGMGELLLCLLFSRRRYQDYHRLSGIGGTVGNAHTKFINGKERRGETTVKVIAVMNQKGGIGKTMTAASIAYILAEEHGMKTLVVDADQQGNISMLYNCFEPEGIGMAELLEDHQAIGGNYATSDLIQTTPYDKIDIIPANGYLMRANMKLLMLEQDNQISRFKAAMNEVRTVYDFVIVDCGLLMDMTVTNVLAAAELVVVPVKLGGFEIEAIDNMQEQLETMRRFNPDIKMKVLMTMCQKNKTTLQTKEWLQYHSGHDCFTASVRRSIIAEKSTMAHLPLPKFSKNGITTQDYRAVTLELLKGE